jgi:hypothetical protein
MTDRLSQLARWRSRAWASARDRIRPSRSEVAGWAIALIAWVLIVFMAEPFGREWGTGQDAYCYYWPTLADPYARSDWTEPIAYVYSPAFLQLVTPLTTLPWQAFLATWTVILLAAVRFLTGPRLLWFGVLVGLMELAGGNISLLLAAAMVVGFRWPAAWAFVLLTKVTPGIGLLWFVVRREWTALFTALAATAAIVLVSGALMPGAWAEWATVLQSVAGRGGTWAAVPIPFIVRLPLAVIVVVWGARTDRRWAVPVAGMIALPALWYGGFSMLLATIALNRPEWRGQGGPGADDATPSTPPERLPSPAPA